MDAPDSTHLNPELSFPGEEYLKRLGFPEEVTSFVRNHVEAKRFLVATDHDYYQGKTEGGGMGGE